MSRRPLWQIRPPPEQLGDSCPYSWLAGPLLQTNHQRQMSSDSVIACGLPRRFMAILYDLMLLASVLFCATVLLLPLTGGAAIAGGNPAYTGYLLLWCYLYFTWQWVYGGQTLGMKAWRIRLVSSDGEPVTWLPASVRFILAMLSWLCAGCGFLWALIDTDGKTLHDRGSGTFPVLGPR